MAILTIEPVHKTNKAGKVLYGVQISDSSVATAKTWQLWRSVSEYRQLQESLCSFAFDLDRRFTGKVQNLSDQEVFNNIVAFFDETKKRPDISKHLLFRDFYELEHPDFEYLDEWTKVVIDAKDSTIIDFSWDAANMILLSAWKVSNKVSKLTSFLKELMSSADASGIISIHKFIDGKCYKLKQIVPQAQPLRISWSPRSSMLHICTNIGIFIYSVSLLKENLCDCAMIQFIKMFDIRDMEFVQRLGTTFYCTPQQVYAHSLNKESNKLITKTDLNNINSLAVEKKRERLYVSSENQVSIYSFASLESVSLSAVIREFSGSFDRLLVSRSEAYLFGLSPAGFITVFETRPQGKQKLMCTYTNIDCPEKSPFLAFNEKDSMFIVSKDQYIVLIDTKNTPLYAGGTHKKRITSGIYDDINNIVITGGEDGEIILYNISMSQKYEQFLKDI